VFQIVGVGALVVSVMNARKNLLERGHENLRMLNETGDI
jgi:hypothetical protein